MKRTYVYALDDMVYHDASDCHFDEGVPSGEVFDVNVFMSQTLLLPGMVFESEGVTRRVGTIRNLRLSKNLPSLATHEEFLNFSNQYPINPDLPLNIIVITPLAEDIPVRLHEIGSLHNWSSEHKPFVADILPRYIAMEDDDDETVRIPIK